MRYSIRLPFSPAAVHLSTLFRAACDRLDVWLCQPLSLLAPAAHQPIRFHRALMSQFLSPKALQPETTSVRYSLPFSSFSPSAARPSSPSAPQPSPPQAIVNAFSHSVAHLLCFSAAQPLNRLAAHSLDLGVLGKPSRLFDDSTIHLLSAKPNTAPGSPHCEFYLPSTLHTQPLTLDPELWKPNSDNHTLSHKT